MLENLTSRGLTPNLARLFVVDGCNGLRAAVRSVFGKRALVQRCPVHKVRNVIGHLALRDFSAIAPNAARS